MPGRRTARRSARRSARRNARKVSRKVSKEDLLRNQEELQEDRLDAFQES